MAKYIIPPKGTTLIKCRECGTLYAPERKCDQDDHYGRFFEKCPTCGFDLNWWGERIPLWKYNLIKWFRGGFES